MLLDRLKYKKSNFESGGLLESATPRGSESKMDIPIKFCAPRKVDSRDMCLSSSNQYKTPHCAGYTMAGYLEYYNWKTKHYPEQVDGDKIYAAAKKIDGNNNPGTWLSSVAKAAINLNLIQGSAKSVWLNDLQNAVKFALHEHGVCLSGFKITNEWNWVDKKTGIIRDLGKKAKQNGGHAVLLCGYNEIGVFIQNSWGVEWGHHGFAILRWNQVEKQLMRAMVIDTKS
jgi:hypothetical protein